MILPRSMRAAHSLVVVALLIGALAVGETPVEPRAVSDGSVSQVSVLPQHRVSYRGVSVEAPASWPVVDLDADPTACVRMDRPTVYVGAAGADQRCPARALATAETIWLAPTTAADTASVAAPQARVERRLGASVRTRWDAVSGSGVAVVPGAGVSIRTTSPTGGLTTTDVVDTLGAPTAGPSATSPTTPTSAPSTATLPLAPTAYAESALAAAPTGRSLTGMWFDACTAPSAASMATWKATSPYAAVGVYIGGALRGCAQPNLTASWVSTVTGQGWGLAPIYVGLQAPCVNASLSTFTPSNAASTGTTSAADAAAKARALGLAAGSTIHYDLENYATGNASCTSAVLTMVSAWTTEIRRQGFSAGVYGNVGSLMTDLSRARSAATAGFVAPDQVWYALWDGLQTTSTGLSSFPDSYWAGQRLHQYRGDFTETWGGVTMAIDASWSTAPMPGNPTQVSYGAGILGPGSAGFAFTGQMTYWRPSPGGGVAGRAYWTKTAGSTTEYNGATWSPSLAPGTYAVDVNVPGTVGATGIGHYTVTDAAGSHAITLNQSTASGYRTLGSAFVVQSGKPIRVHLGDNEPSSTTGVIAADAARFRLLVSVPSAPTGVGAVAGHGQATVSWTAPSNMGAAITGYTVTASPGGARATVSGATTQALVSGLTDGTSYTFTVTATNAVGTGAVSAPSAAVIPSLPGRIVPTAPVRILDTRVGTTANTRRTALAAGESLSVRVAGVSGSPVVAGATSAYLNVTVTGATSSGYLSLAPVAGTNSNLNYGLGQTVANLSLVRLRSDGTTTLTNRSTGTAHVILDAEASVVAGSTGSLWNPVTPVRLVDTRVGTTANALATAIAPGATVRLRVAGVSGSPVPAGATVAGLNLTATAPTKGGYLRVSDGTQTGASAVNYGPGSTVANVALAKLAADGTVTVLNGSTGTVQLVVDVEGYAAASGSLVTPTAPQRLMDTRFGAQANPGTMTVGAGATVTVRVAGVVGSPVPAGATSAVLNLTVASPTAAGQLSISPGGSTISSAANFAPGRTVAGLVLSALSHAGTVLVTNQSRGAIALVVDVQGYGAP